MIRSFSQIKVVKRCKSTTLLPIAVLLRTVPMPFGIDWSPRIIMAPTITTSNNAHSMIEWFVIMANGTNNTTSTTINYQN